MRFSTEAIEAACRGIDSDHALSIAIDRAMNAAAQMEPWSLMGRPNGTSYIMPGDQSKDAECRAVYTSRDNAERALKGWNRLCEGADKFQQILALFDTLSEKDQQHFVDCLWDSDNLAFSDNLCERIADEWRRGRAK